ncbi:MAG: neuraminidase-like domain-containing protein [Wolbachia sp.]
MTTDSNIVETTFKTKEDYNECDHCQSVLSPAAYFVKLMETIEKYITQPTGELNLKSRRPDLFNKIKLDCDSTNKAKLYLEIVNEIMEENLKKGSNGDILQKLATAKYPFNLPANFPLISIRAYLREYNISLAEVCKALISNVDTTLEDLDLSPEAYQMIISNDTTEGYLKETYGIDQPLDQLKETEKFTAQTDVEHNKLQLLFNSYNEVKRLTGTSGLTIDHVTKTIHNLTDQALGFLHRFIRLANKLNWSFAELAQALIVTGKSEIDNTAMKIIAGMKNLQNKLKQPLAKIFELHLPQNSISDKADNIPEFKSLLNENYASLQDLIVSTNNHSVNGYSALQNILSVNSNELTSLIEYNDSKSTPNQTGKLLLFRIYKQVSLARLIGVSITELTQFLLLLNINELGLDNVERVVELNDWLKKYSVTIQQLNNLVNPSELIRKQASEIGQVEEKEILYNKISKYVQIQRDILDAAYEFTTKYGQSSAEKLLHNIAIFTTLKLSAEDISNITKHKDAYGMQAEWSLSQIKTLMNYKTLNDTFSSGGITLPQYTDWLNGGDHSKDEVIEKVAQLTNWNKDTLENIEKVEAFKSYFTKAQNPTDSLLKIKSFMDLIIQSGINSKVLLSLKDLYTLAAESDDKWKKYTDAVSNLELSTKIEIKNKVTKYLAQQKRDILARHMICKLKLRNMRDLYSHLLIDVEMSDCSKISPLKAALNSVQLYIHRCMMKLEQGITVNPELNEEKWRWLSSYREWEAINKIRLYPENYLNPTLRKIATPGYKALQNTLMQGNIVGDAINNAYMQYFEDFEEVASLKIVDSCFERVEDKVSGEYKNTLYIIGRTLAQPYNYYCRKAVFNEENREILYWTAWERIEISIPVETVTPIYAFNRLFIFWVQQTKKKDVNVKDYKTKEDLPMSDNAHVTISYTFQKPSGSWTAPQELASNVEVESFADVNKLYWKKVAAFYLTEKNGKEKRIVIAINKIEDKVTSNASPSSLFILDEDLVASENKKGSFLDASYNSELGNATPNLSCDVDKGIKDKLWLKFTRNVFKSNVTNKEDNAEFVSDTPIIKLLRKFKVSLTQQVINKPGWFIIEGCLERENIRESFLLLPKAYDLYTISSKSTYEVSDEGFKFKYESRIPQTELSDIGFTFIRLNITGNVRELRQKAYAGGPKRILTLDSQKIEQLKFERFQPGDAVIDNPPDILDFSGAYGIYLWEIFFHIPTLIAWHLNQEQDFAKARKWYQYILNPTNDTNQAWQFLPFTQHTEESIRDGCTNTQTTAELEIDPFDPYVIAKQHATSFEKYIIISYIDNLIDWGDILFAKGSWEALNQATMLYVRAWDLLGRKPTNKGKFAIEAKTFEELKASQISGDLCKLELELPAGFTCTQSASEVYDMTKYSCYFCKPENEYFISLWNRVEDRLYKIRHCLDITGKSAIPPLFQPPIDPKQTPGIGGSNGGNGQGPISNVLLPHYRFSYMVAYAKLIVETVIQFGSELLNVLEKRDAEALAILYNKQEGVIAHLITSIKEKTIEALKEEAKALNVSLSSAKDRKLHYENLINIGLSAGEKKAISLSSEAIDIRTGVAVIRGAAAAAHLIPTVYGFAVGDFKPGSAIEVGANIAESAAMILDGRAQVAYTKESYTRRAEDWELQRIMASHDTEQITHQMEANKINQANAEQDLKVHKESIKQIKEKEEFFRSKFSNQELYNWMKGQIASIYFQAYKMALEVAKQAEKTYQYELNNDKEFITNSSWNSLKEGLLAGNSLKFTLEQMAKSYNEGNKRTLEISKVVSLRQIDPVALSELKTKGSCKFALTEKLFDLDFPGHYCRKIKNIKITAPAVVGPYENIHASLQQTSNKIVLKPDIEAIKYLLGEEGSNQPQEDVLRVNWKHNQQIAISKGDQDSGLFELNFNDERYLPFEGTGAISDWELNLPQATNRFNTSAISDVIIHIDYTAFDGGKELRDEVQKLSKLKYYRGMLLVNLSTTYPDTWENFKQKQGRASELMFKPSAEIFLTYAKNPSIDLAGGNNIYIIPTIPDISEMAIKVNDYVWDRNTKKIVNPTLTIGSDWNIKVNNADISQIEEISVIIPYRAEINWQN